MDESDRPAGDSGETWPDQRGLWQAWLRALGLHAPLSGDVTQALDTSFVRSFGEQLGFININTTRAGDAQLERRIVEQVASYGRQLGRVLDALDVLIRHDRRDKLGPDDQRALDELRTLRDEIEATKECSAREQVDRLVAEIRALRRHPEANRAALRRLREALEDE